MLLVSTATRWLGTARMPRVLARAGFDVGLLAPPDSLALHSRHVARIGHLPASAIPMEWLVALIRMVDDFEPHWLVPCDEMAVRLLFTLVLDTPPGLAAATRARLLALAEESLGDPGFYATSIDKTLLPPAAEALGVLVPPYAIVAGVDEAREHARSLGFPILLKRRYGFAGEGVAVVDRDDDVRAEAQRLLHPDQLDLGEQRAPRLLVQRFIRGAYLSQALVARGGRTLAGFAWERASATTPIKGQTVLLRFVHSPETRAMAEALCTGFGMSGFFNVQFVVDEKSGEAHMLEINRRIVTHTHLGERVGVDVGVALHRELSGEGSCAAEPHADSAGKTIVVFPREWLRDPQSELLRRHPVDVPWDEPALVAAMVAMREEG